MIVQVPSSLTTIMKMIIIDYPTSSDHDEDEDGVNDEMMMMMIMMMKIVYA